MFLALFCSHSLIACAQMSRFLGEDRWQWPSITETRSWKWPSCEVSPSEGTQWSWENARNGLWQHRGVWSSDGSRANNHTAISKCYSRLHFSACCIEPPFHFSPSPIKPALDKHFSPRRREIHFTWLKAAGCHKILSLGYLPSGLKIEVFH